MAARSKTTAKVAAAKVPARRRDTKAQQALARTRQEEHRALYELQAEISRLHARVEAQEQQQEQERAQLRGLLLETHADLVNRARAIRQRLGIAEG